jgi:hypothetical protein
MKQPRVRDFDPRAQEKPLKSPMDDFPTIQSQPHQSLTEDTRTPSTGGTPRTPVLGVPLAPRRKIKQRWPFDIYADQFEELKKLAMEDKMRGGVGSMSAMVREAIDDLIAKKRG